MRKIITALANPELSILIKQKCDVQIVAPDIQYQDGVIEILEKIKNADFLILNSIIYGELNIYDFINKIKEINQKIDVIIILENKNIELENFLNAKRIFNIFYNNKNTINELNKIINKKNILENENQINEEIKLLKELILEKNNNKNKITIIKNNLVKIKENIKNNFKKEFIKKHKKIKNKKNIKKSKQIVISVAGIGGVGKSIFCSVFSQLIKNKKILIVDFDILNSSINSIFGVKKYKEKNANKIEDLIIKINNNIDMLGAVQFLFDDEYKIKKEKFAEIIKKEFKKYDLVIIDNSSECFFDYTKEIFKNSDLILFIVEPNLTEIQKSKNLLNIYINKWKIKKEKFNIIFNKININSIDNKILKNIFSEFNIMGNIKLNINYNLIINKNIKNINKEIKKEFKLIINKIIN